MHVWACLVLLEVAAVVHASLYVSTCSFILASPFLTSFLLDAIYHYASDLDKETANWRRDSVDIFKLAEMLYASSNSSHKTLRCHPKSQNGRHIPRQTIKMLRPSKLDSKRIKIFPCNPWYCL
uniref:Putative secreted protein n=1 Tax=Ixodes ricinus TaxID=34613 RepID=A0A6B0UPY4_IXORI